MTTAVTSIGRAVIRPRSGWVAHVFHRAHTCLRRHASSVMRPQGNIGDYIPQWAGGPPKNLPPRPGTPEYDEFKRRIDAEAARDKSDDPPGQKPTDCAGGACPQR